VMMPCTNNSIDIFGKRTGNVDQTPPPATKCLHQITEMAHGVPEEFICSIIHPADLFTSSEQLPYGVNPMIQVYPVTPSMVPDIHHSCPRLHLFANLCKEKKVGNNPHPLPSLECKQNGL
jgi:hypothetical protein